MAELYAGIVATTHRQGCGRMVCITERLKLRHSGQGAWITMTALTAVASSAMLALRPTTQNK